MPGEHLDVTRRFVRTTRRCRTGQHILAAEDRLPENLRTTLALIN